MSGRRDAEFEELYLTTRAHLFRVAYGVAGDRTIAEDALQSAYAKVYASWSRVQAAENPRAYVRRIAVNEVLDVVRRPWFRAERPTDDPQPGATPSHEGSTVERDAVWRAVRALAPRQRAVIVLRYYEGLSEAEIARTLGCSTGTVKSQASAALTNLRARGLTSVLSGDLV